MQTGSSVQLCPGCLQKNTRKYFTGKKYYSYKNIIFGIKKEISGKQNVQKQEVSKNM